MRKNLVSIIALILVIALLVFTAFVGLEIGSLKIPKLERGVKLGLDLVGGSEITFEPEVPEGMSAEQVDDGIETARIMLRQRLDTLGYTEANIYRSGDRRIVLEIPGVEDPEQAVQMLGASAVVQFRDADGNVIIEGKDIVNAAAMTSQGADGMNGFIVEMELNEEGTNKFREGTKAAAARAAEGNNYVAIYLDDELISQPQVDAQYATTGIDTNKPIIELGSSDSTYATYLAGIIKSGALPFVLRESKLQNIGAQLGERSLDFAIMAGIIGVGLIMLFMLVFYRLPGLIADFSLVIYILLFLVCMSLFGVNLTLPGIAGIVLTCGMAVDANIIIYERIKEELSTGRSLKASIDAGFKRALTAILDGNITTILAAIVLASIGAGTVKGFAITLLIGVIISMLVMLLVPRLLLKICADMGVNKLSLYMGKRKELKTDGFSYVKNFKKFAIVSGIFCALAIVGFISQPFGGKLFNLDQDFVGGTMIDIELGQEVTPEVSTNVEGIVNQVVGFAPSSVTKSGNGGTIVSIKMQEVTTENRDALYLAIAEAYGGTEKVSVVSSDFVSASAGRDITNSAFLATVIAAALILIYVAFRFELRSGVAAILMLLHDVLVMLAFYIIFRIPMNMNFIAAVLTVVGYSINATIVIYDRIRENWKKSGGQGDFADVVNKSIRQTLTRSIATTITTLLPLIMVTVLGVSSVRNFGFPIALGLAVGCYSSVFMSAPMWNIFKGKKGKVR